MSKRIFTSLVFLSLFFTATAQDYKVISVEALPMDMSARKHIKTDDNDKQCALFRIATQNISPEKKEGFHFDSDYGSQVVEHTIIDGEIWVWVSPGIKTLKISHKEWGKYELQLTKYLPKVASLFTYRIVIEGLFVTNKTGALTISSLPTGADLFLSGEYVGITPYTATLPYGTYPFVLKKDFHKDFSGEVVLDNEIKGVQETLDPICGGLELRTEPDSAIVQIDGINCGTSPIIMKSILIGPHNLKIEKKGFESETIHVLIEEDQIYKRTIKLTQISINPKRIKEKPNKEKTNKKQNIDTPTIVLDDKYDPHSLSSRIISTVPSITRNINDVLSLIPQSATTSNGLAIGGGNYRQSHFTIDGASYDNFFGIGSNIPAGGSPISLNAIEAMTINVTPFDVRHSGFTGGAINAVTKSGTNNTHVSVYDYFTNDGLIGTKFGKADELGNYPDRLTLAKSLDNTIGVSVGGPIVKDKLFYFVNFEYQTDIDPGQTHFARESENDEWGGSTQYSRPTVDRMNEISNYLQTTYSYNPGRYQNYSASTPDYKTFIRLDWINRNDHVKLHYNLAKSKYSNSPSNSVNPIVPNPYNRNSYGRTSDCALYFESNRYFQEQNFSSVAAEWNHSFLSGRGNNMLRATYSHQNEPRSFVGDLFPTVDILENLDTDGDGVAETKAVYTSFGPDPFTYGNFRDVKTAVVTDEVSYLTGIHNFTLGGQYEFDNTKNGYMQGGAGYYVYNSWDDFVNGANPTAFAITFGNNRDNNGNPAQVYPSFSYLQGSIYLQDEMTLNKRFKLSLGLRAEMPYYPSIAGYNYNKEFAEGWDGTSIDGTVTHHAIADGEDNTMSGLSTADMPKARVNFSPRLGFNWDLTGDRKYIVRGGSGLYTGRLPFVWIVSTVGNSNCLQYQYINANAEFTDIHFYSDLNQIISNHADLFGTQNLPADLAAPQSTTIMDKNLRMPQTWKSSLAFDAEIPGGIKATLEGIYNKDVTSVAVRKLGIVRGDDIQLPGELEKRWSWKSEGVINSLGKAVTPYYITNSENNGYYYSVTGQLSKDFKCGLNLMAAYTYAEGKNVTDGIGDQISSAFSTNAFGVNGSNAHELGYSSYVSPNRFLISLGWILNSDKHSSTTIGLYYEGFNLCYIGNYSYTRYSYTMTSNVNGDGGSNSLVYIPTKAELAYMPFSSEENKTAYNDFIYADKYLSAHRGQYAQRGGAIAPWHNTINFKFNYNIKFLGNKSVGIGIDMKNLANLFYRGWGNMQKLSSSDILKWNGTEYTFTDPTWNEYASTYSTWSAALNLRLNF